MSSKTILISKICLCKVKKVRIDNPLICRVCNRQVQWQFDEEKQKGV